MPQILTSARPAGVNVRVADIMRRFWTDFSEYPIAPGLPTDFFLAASRGTGDFLPNVGIVDDSPNASRAFDYSGATIASGGAAAAFGWNRFGRFKMPEYDPATVDDPAAGLSVSTIVRMPTIIPGSFGGVGGSGVSIIAGGTGYMLYLRKNGFATNPTFLEVLLLDIAGASVNGFVFPADLFDVPIGLRLWTQMETATSRNRFHIRARCWQYETEPEPSDFQMADLGADGVITNPYAYCGLSVGQVIADQPTSGRTNELEITTPLPNDRIL